MKVDLQNRYVVGVSSSAIFETAKERAIFEELGIDEYLKYQIENENNPYNKGTAYSLIESLLSLNKQFDEPIVEVIIISKNSPETGLRVFNSVNYYELDISRAAFTGGDDIAKYLKAFKIDLFLSMNEKDVQESIDSGVSAAIIYNNPNQFEPNMNSIRLAFDADAVIFNEDSELISKTKGLEEFIQNEKNKADVALEEGPLSNLLKFLSKIKQKNNDLIRIAVVTARNSPAHKRVILTLRKWGVKVDEAFFMGGMDKTQILKAFNPHIFFDDQDYNVKPASENVPAARVPYKTDSPLNKI